MNIKEEVYKCSKCGLCKSVCPIYVLTKNEMLSPRGRYIVLNRYFDENKKLSKEFIKNLDLCLNCNQCKNFCPSGIDTYKINTLLKSEYKKFHAFSIFYPVLMRLIRIKANIYRLLNYYPNKYELDLYKEKVKRKKNNSGSIKKGTVVYFEGCYNKYINPSDKNASLNLIEKSGFKVKKTKNFCCGYPYLSCGDIKKFKKNAQKIINIVPKDCEYIICSCDSCFDTLMRISDYISDTEEFKNKLITLDKFLEINNIKVSVNDDNILYHKPVMRTEKCTIDGIKEINQKHNASLMENFILLHKTGKYLSSMLYTKEQVQGKTVITTCNISKWGLKLGFNKRQINAKVLSLAEFIELNKKVD